MAQQTNVGVPSTLVGDSFYELYGVHWGFRQMGPNGGVFFDNGGFGGVLPPFGAFDPNAGAGFGFARGGPGGGFFLNFYASQGNQRSLVSSASTLTLPNGGIGSVYGVSTQPFVTGVIPVVGSARKTSPLDERLERYRRGERPGVRDPSPATTSATLVGTGRTPPANDRQAAFVATPANLPAAQVPPQDDTPLVRRASAEDPALALAARPDSADKPRPERSELHLKSDQAGSNSTPHDFPTIPTNGTSFNASPSNATPSTASPTSTSIASSAQRGDLSLAEIRRRRAELDSAESAARRSEVISLVEQGRSAEKDGKPAVARIFYQQALRRATPDLRADIETRLKALAAAK